MNEEEKLAIILSCGSELRAKPETRVDMLALWESKKEETRVAYRLRVKRLLRAWDT